MTTVRKYTRNFVFRDISGDLENLLTAAVLVSRPTVAYLPNVPRTMNVYHRGRRPPEKANPLKNDYMNFFYNNYLDSLDDRFPPINPK